MAKKKKSFFKKAKVKIPAKQLIILTSVIASLCVIMLFFSVLFPGQKKTEKPEGNLTSVGNSVSTDKQVENQIGNNHQPENLKVENNIAEKPENKRQTAENQKTEKVVETVPERVGSEKKQSETPVNSKNKGKSSESVPVYETSSAKPEGNGKTEPSTVPVVKDEPVKHDYGIPKAKNNAQLIFVFDDGGQNLSQLKKYLALPFPVSIAVLPKIAHSAESARLIKNSMHELMLHQPMQALNLSVNPGPGAITPEMDVHSARSLIAENIAELGGVAGFNNHEGSMILENTVLVEAIIEEAENQGVFFLDSKTSAASKAPAVAQEMGTRIYTRDIFLDNVKTRENVMSELLKGLEIANKKGYCIMIGHVWSADLIPAILMELYPVLKEKGYTFSVVSKSKGR